MGFDTELLDWYKDRAAILGGIPFNVLVRDVLATWAQLVTAAEKEQGIDLASPEVKVPERIPGYKSALVPRGDKPSHLDDSPLEPEEQWQTR